MASRDLKIILAIVAFIAGTILLDILVGSPGFSLRKLLWLLLFFFQLSAIAFAIFVPIYLFVQAARELTLRDLLKILIALVVVIALYHFRKGMALTLTTILILSLVIPERARIAEKVWSVLTPSIPRYDELSVRFSSSAQTLKDSWRGFRRSALSIIGLLMVVLVIDFSLYADSIAQQEQESSITGQEVWPIYRDDPETGETLNLYTFKKLPPFSGPKEDTVTSSPSDADQKLQLDVQTANGDQDNDGDFVLNLLDQDDDNDGITDFADQSPSDFDNDWNSTCDEESWFDNTSGMFCGPDYLDLDDDSDGLLDYDEVSDNNPLTDIYDHDNDGIQDGVTNREGTTVSLRVHHDAGWDQANLVMVIESVKPFDDQSSGWGCQGCIDGELVASHGMFSIDEESGQWSYVFASPFEYPEAHPGPWDESILVTNSESAEFNLDLSISEMSEAPSFSALPASPSPFEDDEWYSVKIPANATLSAFLNVDSGSDYNLYLYDEEGVLADAGINDNGCPDFYTYDFWLFPEEYQLCPMGTTHTGSDMMSKILYGSRKSLRVGFTVAFTTCFLGLVIGGISGYFGGRIDEVIMRIADIFFAVPGLILAMAVVTAMNDINDLGAIGFEEVKLDRLEKIMIALVFTGWPGYSRLIRGQVLSVKEHTYIEAAKSVGASDFRVLFRHVLPNAWAPMIVAVSLDVGGTILTASGLSFIGLGAEANSAEWGKMISDGRSFFPTHWWMVTFPGLAILTTTLGFNLLGDGLRDVMDPRQRRSKS